MPQGSDQTLITRTPKGLRDFFGFTAPGENHAKRNAEWVRQQFEADKHMRPDYLRAAGRHPHLFQNDRAAIVSHIEPVVRHFASDGLTREAYFRAVAAEPLLLRQKPATVINNLEAVMSGYNADLPMRREYVQAALAQPKLFRTPSAEVVNAVQTEADRIESQAKPHSMPSTQVQQAALCCCNVDSRSVRR